MKYCEKCGTQLEDNVIYCPNCGTNTEANNNYQYNNYNPYYQQPHQSPVKKNNGMAIAGFILAFISPLLGWIFGGLGLNQAIKYKSGKGLAIAALIISTLNFILSVLMEMGIIQIY